MLPLLALLTLSAHQPAEPEAAPSSAPNIPPTGEPGGRAAEGPEAVSSRGGLHEHCIQTSAWEGWWCPDCASPLDQPSGAEEAGGGPAAPAARPLKFSTRGIPRPTSA